jgi:hypothetical protein
MGDIIHQNGLVAHGTSPASLLPRQGEAAAAIDLEHKECCVERRTAGATTDCRFAGYYRHQEQFLFDVINIGQLPMRNLIQLGPCAGRITCYLTELYPSARVSTLDPNSEPNQSVQRFVEASRSGFEPDILKSNALAGSRSFDVAIAVEVFQGQTRTRVRSLVENLAAVSRYIVNIDWSEPWPWKAPDGLWCHEYQSLYSEAGLNCASFLLPEKTGGLQQKLFVASRKMTPEMVRLMDKAEEDLGGY